MVRAPAAAVHPRRAARTTPLAHSHLLLIRRRHGQVREDEDGGGRVLALPWRPRAGLMLLLLLSCSPGCCRGVDWRGLGCMYEMEMNYFTHYS